MVEAKVKTCLLRDLAFLLNEVVHAGGDKISEIRNSGNQTKLHPRLQIELELVDWVDEVEGTRIDGVLVLPEQPFKTLNGNSSFFDFQNIFDCLWLFSKSA